MKSPLVALGYAALLTVPVMAQAWEPARWDPAKAEPAVPYGVVPDFTLPKTILFSVGPDEIITNAQAWQRHGISAFFLDFVARDWSSDVWAADGEAWTIGASDKTFQKTRQATAVARRLGSEVFLKVSSPVEQPAQLRFGSNDAGKVWLGGKLIHDYPREGTAELDRDIVPISLPKGTSPLLVKITNNRFNWGFVLRLTDSKGRPLRNVKFSLSPG